MSDQSLSTKILLWKWFSCSPPLRGDTGQAGCPEQSWCGLCLYTSQFWLLIFPSPSVVFVHQSNILYYCFYCWQCFIYVFIWYDSRYFCLLWHINWCGFLYSNSSVLTCISIIFINFCQDQTRRILITVFVLELSVTLILFLGSWRSLCFLKRKVSFPLYTGGPIY